MGTGRSGTAQKGYSGVALLVSKELAVVEPSVAHPAFDFEQRIATVDLISWREPLTVASVYVPNGGKDYEAKLQFLASLDRWAGEAALEGRRMVALRRPERRARRARRSSQGAQAQPDRNPSRRTRGAGAADLQDLVDVGRTLDPDNDNLFTWWAPWRNLRQRNIGWRIDYVLASSGAGRSSPQFDGPARDRDQRSRPGRRSPFGAGADVPTCQASQRVAWAVAESRAYRLGEGGSPVAG